MFHDLNGPRRVTDRRTPLLPDQALGALARRMPHELRAMVAPVFLAPVVSEAVRHQLPLQTLLRGLGIDPADFDDPAFIVPHTTAIALIRRALLVMPIGDLGLQLGQRTTLTERGILSLGQLAAATLGDALELSLRFPQRAGYLLKIRAERHAHGHQFVAESFAGDHDRQSFLVDLTFSASVQLRRQATATDYAPSEVHMVRTAPAHSEAYAAFFGCPVRFGRPRNVLVTHADWLNFPMPMANGMARRLSSQLLECESQRLNAVSVVSIAVESAIRRRLPAIALLSQLAESLHLSERTVRRQLAQDGLSYRHLLDEGRKSRAFDLMANGQRTIADIAAETGFSNATAFSKTFKRWTGHPPSQLNGTTGAGAGAGADAAGRAPAPGLSPSD